MEKGILPLNQVELIKRQSGTNTLVLVGGCFDLLHYGHYTFLQRARQLGDTLVIALESDEFIKTKKQRIPVHNQQQRAEILKALHFVDYVILLPFFQSDNEYVDLVQEVHPDIIAVTENDPHIDIKRKQAKLVGAKVVIAAPLLPDYSSSSIIPHADLSSN